MSVHFMDVAEPYFSLIKMRKKPVEGRKLSPTWSKIKVGDIITMTCNSSYFNVLVTGINKYNSLKEYLLGETLQRCLPGVTSIEDGERIYLQWSSIEEINKYGMIGIQVSVLD
jgi:ASC-1-like (ASCH) protein